MAQPEDLLYSKEHEWVRLDGENATIGITDYAQESDLFTPMSGKVVEINTTLDGDPAAVNREPYGAGWLFKLKLSDPDEAKSLLSAADYEKITAE